MYRIFVALAVFSGRDPFQHIEASSSTAASGCAAKCIFASFHWLPLLDFVGVESKRMHIRQVCSRWPLAPCSDSSSLAGAPGEPAIFLQKDG